MLKTAALLLAYVVAIVAANVLTARLGLVPVGFGLMATAGTYAAGLVLLARDFVQRQAGPLWALLAIVVGILLSWILASPALALASAAAFAISELIDFAVFSLLRRRSFARAAAVSNLVSAPLDTIAFLLLAGFPLTGPALAGQVLVKLLWGTAVPLAIYEGSRRRAILRQPLDAPGA